MHVNDSTNKAEFSILVMHIYFMSTASQNNLPEKAMTSWPPYKYTELKKQCPSYGYN